MIEVSDARGRPRYGKGGMLLQWLPDGHWLPPSVDTHPLQLLHACRYIAGEDGTTVARTPANATTLPSANMMWEVQKSFTP